MFLKNFQLLFLGLLILGTLIAISANSWFTVWLGLEINLMSIIPLMLIKLNPSLSESSIKYFLAQAMASVILIFSFSLNFLSKEMLNLEILEFFIVFALGLKAGLAPLHYWFPQVINNLNWNQCIIMLTWQKVAPLILICSLNIYMAVALSLMSGLTGALGGFNQIIMKMVLTYSSISHGGWMIIACLFNLTTWITYFLIYCIISISIISFFNSNQIEKTSEIFTSQSSEWNKNILSMNLLSLGGLPPLLGFTAKLNIIMMSLKFNMILILTPLILSSLISLFFYMRIIYSNLFFTNKAVTKNFMKTKTNFMFNSMSIMMNILTPFIFLT